MSSPKAPRPVRDRRKAGTARLVWEWLTFGGNLFILAIALLVCIPFVVYVQQLLLFGIGLLFGLLIDLPLVARIGAAVVLVVATLSTGPDFWATLALNVEIGDVEWRIAHGAFAVVVAVTLGVVLGGIVRWLFEGDEQDEDDNDEVEESVVTTTRPTEPTALEPDRTLAHEPGPPTPPVVDAGSIGEFEVLGELGRGGMGVVYKARHRGMGRLVALKTVLERSGSAARAIQRFRGEAEAVARLDHPGIVPVYEFGEHGGQQFFTMGFVDGPSLATRLAAGPVEPAVAAMLVRQAAEAVAFAHDRGVIHRDIKPGNILLAPGGDAKVTDFGLARRIDLVEIDEIDTGDDSASEAVHTIRRLTQTGAVMGTPAYMAPEQALDAKRVGPAADVWALGAVLYACLTGRPPFQGSSVAETLTLVIEANPPRPRDLTPTLDRDLEAVCLKCLQKDPDRRYQSAADLAADLGRWQAKLTPRAARVGVFERLRRLDAHWPEALPVLVGLAVARLGNVQEAVFVGSLLAGAWMIPHVPRIRSLTTFVVIWATLASIVPYFALMSLDPIPAERRSQWSSNVSGIARDAVRRRARWDRYIASQEEAAEKAVARARTGVGLSLLAGGLLGAMLAVGRRSIQRASPEGTGYGVGYLAAVAVSAVVGLVAALCAYRFDASSWVSIAGRWVLDDFGVILGGVFAVPTGLAAGVCIHGIVRRFVGPTRVRAQSAGFGARFAAAVAVIALFACGPHLIPPGEPVEMDRYEWFGPGPLLAAAERWLTQWLGLPVVTVWPAVFVLKLVVVVVSAALSAVVAAVLLRGRKLS